HYSWHSYSTNIWWEHLLPPYVRLHDVVGLDADRGRRPFEGQRLFGHTHTRQLGQERKEPTTTGEARANAAEHLLIQSAPGDERGPGGRQPDRGNGHLALMVVIACGRIPDDDLARAGIEHVETTDANGRLAASGDGAQIAQHAFQIRF